MLGIACVRSPDFPKRPKALRFSFRHSNSDGAKQLFQPRSERRYGTYQAPKPYFKQAYTSPGNRHSEAIGALLAARSRHYRGESNARRIQTDYLTDEDIAEARR